MNLSPTDLKKAKEIYITKTVSSNVVMKHMQNNLDLKLGRDFEYVTNQKLNGKYVGVLFLMNDKAVYRWVPGSAIEGFTRTNLTELRDYELWYNDDFDNWYNKNLDKLVDKFLEDNPDLGIHHHDYPNIPSMMAFQNFAEREYNKKFRKKEKVVKRRKDGVVQRYTKRI